MPVVFSAPLDPPGSMSHMDFCTPRLCVALGTPESSELLTSDSARKHNPGRAGRHNFPEECWETPRSWGRGSHSTQEQVDFCQGPGCAQGGKKSGGLYGALSTSNAGPDAALAPGKGGSTRYTHIPRPARPAQGTPLDPGCDGRSQILSVLSPLRFHSCGKMWGAAD